MVPSSWFEPLTAEVCDLLKYDYQRALAGAKRVMVFWDAHGFDIAECVLGVIAPIVADRPHVFLMHDMTDTRYASGSTGYEGQRLWHGENAGTSRFRLGNIDSAVAQAISAQDFTARNRITLDSADHSIDLELNQVPGRVQEIQTLLGDELFAMQAHWFWPSLNEHPGPYTFPRFTLGDPSLADGCDGIGLEVAGQTRLGFAQDLEYRLTIASGKALELLALVAAGEDVVEPPVDALLHLRGHGVERFAVDHVAERIAEEPLLQDRNRVASGPGCRAARAPQRSW